MKAQAKQHARKKQNASSKKIAPAKQVLTLIAGLAFCLGCTVCLGACGGKEVSYSSGGMQETQKTGKDSVPADLTSMVYPAATASGSQSTKAEDKDVTDESQYLQLTSPDTIEKVAAWYEQTLKNAGWNIEKKETMGNMVTISGTMKDSEISVTLADESGTTSILVTKSTNVGTGPVPDEGDNENYKPNKDVTPTD
jgi:K+-transporting ATPase c subunit